MTNIRQILFPLLAAAFAACSSDSTNEIQNSRQPLRISGINLVEQSPWGGGTRAMDDHLTQITDGNTTVYVSSNNAAPSPYQYDNGEFKVMTGHIPQEWDGSNAYVYGFFRSDNETSLTTAFSVPTTQNGQTEYSFQASTKKQFTYSESTQGIRLDLYQQLAKVQVTVSDADANTTVYIGYGNSKLYCNGIFGQNFDTSNTATGTWVFSGAATAIAVTGQEVSGTEGRVFTAYILPQTIAQKENFFCVSNSSTNVTAYYRLPSDNYQFQAGYVYKCTLMQDMTVTAINIDTDFSNNNGTAIDVPTNSGSTSD